MTMNELPEDAAVAVVDQVDIKEVLFASLTGERRTAAQVPWGTIIIRLHETQPYFVVVNSEIAAGWGPFLYRVAIELATQESSGLVPDRRTVSEAALHLWERMSYWNDDIRSQPLRPSQAERLYGDEVLDSLYHSSPVIVDELIASGRLLRW